MNRHVQHDVCALVADLFFGPAAHGEATDTGSALSLPALSGPCPDWKAICEELDEQAIPLLFSDYLIEKDLPESVCEKWKSECFDDFDFNIRVLDVLAWLDELLTQNQVPYMVIKGTSAAVLYPRPILRTQGDIDIMIAPEHLEDALRVLNEADCEGEHTLNHEAPDRHYAYKRDKVIIEVHTRFATLNTQKAEKVLDGILYKAIGHHTVRKEVFNVSFPAPPEKLNGLVLLTHINQHLEEGLGLRQIIDWMMYVYRFLNDEAWPSFRKWAAELGLETLAVTVTRMCQLYLGLPETYTYLKYNTAETSGNSYSAVPDIEDATDRTRTITWCQCADTQLCRDLLDYIFECGNFGYKQGMSNSAAMVISHGRGVRGFFRNLQKRGEANWPLYQTHTWLKPFAWAYQLCRYGRIALSRKGAWSSLAKEVDAGRRRGELVDRLGGTSLSRKK